MGLKESGLRGSLRNVSVDIFAIPDSVVEKTIRHYPLLERTNDTIIETVENEDATASGTTNISGDFFRGYAEEADGVDDHILTQFSPTEQLVSDTFSVAFTLETEDLGRLHSVNSAPGRNAIQIGTDIGGFTGNTGGMNFAIRSDGTSSGDFDGVFSSENVDDGERRFYVINKIGNDADDYEIWVGDDTTISEDTNVFRDDNQTGAFTDFTEPMPIFAENNGGDIEDHIGGIGDTFRWMDDSLSQDEVESLHSSQPWVN